LSSVIYKFGVAENLANTMSSDNISFSCGIGRFVTVQGFRVQGSKVVDLLIKFVAQSFSSAISTGLKPWAIYDKMNIEYRTWNFELGGFILSILPFFFLFMD